MLKITPFRALDYIKSEEALRAYVEVFVEEERERCAKVCDDKADNWAGTDDADYGFGARSCAEEIRKGPC